MMGVAKEVGNTSFAPEFTRDLAHLFAGGRVLASSELDSILQSTQYDALKRKSGAREKRNRASYHHDVAKFLRSIVEERQFKKIATYPNSPLYKAMLMTSFMEVSASGEDMGDTGISMPVPGPRSKSTQRAMEAMIAMEELDPIERTLFEDEDGNLPTPMDMASDMKEGLAELLKICKNLDSMPAMARKRKKPVADPSGSDRHFRRMNSVGELHKVENRAWVERQTHRGMFLVNLATKNYCVKERITRQDPRQHIFLLLDVSGSMGSHWPRAGGVLLNRCKAVIKGECVLYIAPFDGRMHGVQTIDTKEKAHDFLETVKGKGIYRGGNTDIPGALESAEKWIQENIQDSRPEIVMVTDDDGGGHLAKPAHKTHVFLCAKNEGLKEIATKTGGVCGRLYQEER